MGVRMRVRAPSSLIVMDTTNLVQILNEFVYIFT